MSEYRSVRAWGVVLGIAATASWGAAAWAATPWTVSKAQLARLKNPVTAKGRKAAIARGKALYAQHCAGCHGESGKGDGQDGMYYTHKPSNLTTAAFAKQSDAVIFYKITHGRTDMPSFAKKLKAAQRWDLVSYLRTLHSGT